MTASSPYGSCQATVERQLGRRLDHDQVLHLHKLILERARRLRITPSTYAARVESGLLDEEVLTLAAHFTVGESYFFRDLAQLELCCDLIGKQLTALSHQGTLRVLSAGCSSGEEIYSLVMLLGESLPNLDDVQFVAMDINGSAIAQAKLGRYSPWSLRETPSHMKNRWFHFDGRQYVLRASILEKVHFARASLCVPSQPLARRAFDVILCRNVLMYFSERRYREAADRLLDSLTPGGYLFLGHAESLRGLELPATLVQGGTAFCYQTSPAASNADLVRDATDTPSSPAAGAPCTNGAAHTANPRKDPLAPSPSHDTTDTQSHLDRNLATLRHIIPLLESERFAEALLALDTRGSGSSAVLELCHALLLVYTNRVEAARELATNLLTVNDVAPGAHYALALCYEFTQDWAQASEHARRSTYLDPTFAMPWLHLGILSRKLGDKAAARRELVQARALLAVESEERLLWFGGGCSRSTLQDACRRELLQTGERP